MPISCQLTCACAMSVDWFMRKSIRQCWISSNRIHLRTHQKKKGYVFIYSTKQRKGCSPSKNHLLWLYEHWPHDWTSLETFESFQDPMDEPGPEAYLPPLLLEHLFLGCPLKILGEMVQSCHVSASSGWMTLNNVGLMSTRLVWAPALWSRTSYLILWTSTYT